MLEDDVREMINLLPTIACDKCYVLTMFHKDIYTKACVRLY